MLGTTMIQPVVYLDSDEDEIIKCQNVAALRLLERISRNTLKGFRDIDYERQIGIIRMQIEKGETRFEGMGIHSKILKHFYIHRKGCFGEYGVTKACGCGWSGKIYYGKKWNERSLDTEAGEVRNNPSYWGGMRITPKDEYPDSPWIWTDADWTDNSHKQVKVQLLKWAYGRDIKKVKRVWSEIGNCHIIPSDLMEDISTFPHHEIMSSDFRILEESKNHCSYLIYLDGEWYYVWAHSNYRNYDDVGRFRVNYFDQNHSGRGRYEKPPWSERADAIESVANLRAGHPCFNNMWDC